MKITIEADPLVIGVMLGTLAFNIKEMGESVNDFDKYCFSEINKIINSVANDMMSQQKKPLA